MVAIENQTIAVLEVKKAYEEVNAALEEVINSEEDEEEKPIEKNPGCVKCQHAFQSIHQCCTLVKTYKTIYDPFYGYVELADRYIPRVDNANGECPRFDLKIYVPKKTILERIPLWIKKLFARG